MPAPLSHAAKRQRLAGQLAAARAAGATPALRKSTSNLFRKRDRRAPGWIDARDFDQVLAVDTARRLIEAEGMTPYSRLADATLRHGLAPAVVPQLKTITAGGAVSGLGIESSSFRYGLVHETVEEMDVLLAGGDVITCSRQNHADLFYGFPNSYGTLGYAVRLVMRLIPAQPLVRVRHRRFNDPENFFDALHAAAADPQIDYLDGVVFGPAEMYSTAGEFTSEGGSPSDYTWRRIYYQSIRRRSEDTLTAAGYLWRWDTDWFWCSRQFGFQNPVVRLLAGRRLLNSAFYQRVMRLGQRLLPDGGGRAPVIQDVQVPLGRAAEFLRFLLAAIGITPIWICPLRSPEKTAAWDLYPVRGGTLYINFGFWDTVPTRFEPGHYNRKVEEKLGEVGGRKGLYSTAWYDRETFWNQHNWERYVELKRNYDPEGAFPDLYEKCVERR